MSKKLFTIKPRGSKKPAPATPRFDNKPQAKAYRDELNSIDASNNYVVAFAEDHHKFAA